MQSRATRKSPGRSLFSERIARIVSSGSSKVPGFAWIIAVALAGAVAAVAPAAATDVTPFTVSLPTVTRTNSFNEHQLSVHRGRI
jgi:hypothetical protein